MRPGPVLTLLLFLPLPLSAAEDAPIVLGPEGFDTYVTGRTVTYAHDGRVYGFEQYLSDRRVIWRPVAGECQEGVWFPQDGHICFAYDGGIELQCWQFYDTGATLGARVAEDPEGMWLYEVERSEEPIDCPLPYFGS